MTIELLKELGGLLAREREALLAGRIAEATGMADRKRELAEHVVVAEHVDPDMLRDLHDAAARNQVLLASAQKGLAAARTRLGEIRRAVTHLDTYTRDGGKLDLMAVASSVERRA